MDLPHSSGWSVEGKLSAIANSLMQMACGFSPVKRSRRFGETSRGEFVIRRRRDRLEPPLLDLEGLDLRLQGRRGQAELGGRAEGSRYPTHGFLQRRLDHRALVFHQRVAPHER